MSGCRVTVDVDKRTILATPSGWVPQSLLGSRCHRCRPVHLLGRLGRQVRSRSAGIPRLGRCVRRWAQSVPPDLHSERTGFYVSPVALAVLSSLTWALFAVSQWLLWVVSVAATTASVAFVLRDRGYSGRASLWCGSFAWACVSMILLEPARSGLNYGQIEFVLMFLVVADLLVVPPPFRGIAIGIAAAIKLTPLIFILSCSCVVTGGRSLERRCPSWPARASCGSSGRSCPHLLDP